ncbi:pyruvate dehydrogenase E1 component subunit alpha [Striga asiatica]|uniref:Pyruvate dehydrogenase E1 component subunit alpha n=1 Tax=Striga asiatica TaxID=4170 RepID=A0A5A7P3A0_STRAF|nr:pyruvate dehydrogenase E1 component subunit alpha [Striga asiatica]
MVDFGTAIDGRRMKGNTGNGAEKGTRNEEKKKQSKFESAAIRKPTWIPKISKSDKTKKKRKIKKAEDLQFEAADELADAHYTTRYPITALKKYITENKLKSEADLKATENKIEEIFADKSPVPARNKLLENVFSDPRGFKIRHDEKYRYEDPKFIKGTAQICSI